MERMIYIILLLCSFLSQGFGIFEENSKSDLHFRKKRLINNTPNGNKPVTLEKIPYIVNIQGDGSTICGGSILSPNYILTAAHCLVRDPNKEYTVLSGSHFKKHGTRHQIIRKIVHANYKLHLNPNDLALLVISPPINIFHSPNRRIKLYNGVIPPNATGIFSGWGCNRIFMGIDFYPRELRSTTMQIISQSECQHYYRNHSVIPSTDICTLHKGGKISACFGDSGGPLVFNNQLLGVLSWSRTYLHPESPDVFMNVAHPEYRNWILSNLEYVH